MIGRCRKLRVQRFQSVITYSKSEAAFTKLENCNLGPWPLQNQLCYLSLTRISSVFMASPNQLTLLLHSMSEADAIRMTAQTMQLCFTRICQPVARLDNTQASELPITIVLLPLYHIHGPTADRAEAYGTFEKAVLLNTGQHKNDNFSNQSNNFPNEPVLSVT